MLRHSRSAKRGREVSANAPPKGRSSCRKGLAIVLLVLATSVSTARLAAETPASTTHLQTFDPAMMQIDRSAQALTSRPGHQSKLRCRPPCGSHSTN
jgi:hypothetical protein